MAKKNKRSLEDVEPLDNIYNYILGNPLNKNYKYILDDDGQWHRIGADDMTRIFEQLVVTPKGNKYNYVPKSIDNSEQGARYRDKMLSRQYTRGLVGEPGLKLADPEFELMNLGLGSLAKRGIKTGIKALYNKYPYSPFIPLNPNRYYRIVGPKDAISGDAIADAIETGYLRTSSLANKFKFDPDPNTITLAPKVFDYMMFSKGAPWKGSLAAVGGKGSKRIIRSKNNIDDIIWEQSNIDFRHKGHKGIFRPRYNGSLEQVPSEYFEYFEKGTGPISKYFWKRYNFK